ncbi:phage tail protein [Pseudovibrio brasiliensis]|uniref:Tail fiber protein n=1 Tax=Pseudovibrio brasiliensis TaxID=1898042 RepID=A0ABX8AVX9_9HYPH|nr:phage tail protein [Pseudovibrio brasiliensis]QUS59213.1 tail fiber protein [Pseudovibrio brasiliensis]
MAVTPNLNLPLLDSEEKVSEDHLKINQFVEALDARLGEFATTVAGLATAGHSHEMSKVQGLAKALDLLASKDHRHKLNDLVDVEVEDAPDGKVLQKIAGKWGLGDRGYSVPEINGIVNELANTTQDVKFKKGISVGNDVYLNNKAIIATDADGEFTDRSGINIDHIYHNDTDNAWHFVSDDSYRALGNSKLVAGRIDLLNTVATMAPSDHWLARIRATSTNTENIPTNRQFNCLNIENRQLAPANGSNDAGSRFFKRGGYLAAFADGASPGITYEMSGSHSVARQRGDSDIRYLYGQFMQGGSDRNSTGNVDSLYGFRSHSYVDGQGQVGVLYGGHISVNPNHADADVTYARGLLIHMDYDGGTVENDPIALYQNFDGAWSGKKKIGIYQNEVQENHLTGKTYINGNEVLHKGNAPKGKVPGEFFYVAGPTAPAGSLIANGAVFDPQVYPELYAAIGTTYGGTASAPRLPDGRGVVARGLDLGRGLDSGRQLGTYQEDAIPNITGQFSVAGNTGPIAFPAGQSNAGHVSGAFKRGRSYSAIVRNTGGTSYGAELDASLVTRTTSGPNAEARMKNIALTPCIQY